MLRLENIAVIGNEIAIAWSDGLESYGQLETLRRACPCANCQGEPDALGRVIRPKVTYAENSFNMLRYEVVGGYAVSFNWADGHSTGLYSFEYLRKICE